MKITKTFNERGAEPKEITREQAIEYLENRGYYREGLIDDILNQSIPVTLRTPWAFYYFD